MVPTVKLAFFNMASTVAYLALTVLGWGGITALFSHTALIVLVIAQFVMSGVAMFSGGNLSAGEREDRGNRWVIAVVGLIGVLMACLPAYTDRKEFWILDGELIRWVGVALFAAGGACFGSGLSLCSAAGSVGWSPSSQDMPL